LIDLNSVMGLVVVWQLLQRNSRPESCRRESKVREAKEEPSASAIFAAQLLLVKRVL